MAVAIYGTLKLAYYRSGDDKWTDLCEGQGYQNVIFHEEKIRAIDWPEGHLYEFDIRTLYGGIIEVRPPHYTNMNIRYVVRNPDGHLLMAVRHFTLKFRNGEMPVGYSYNYKTCKFDLFKLDKQKYKAMVQRV